MTTDTDLARIDLLLKAARLEVTSLTPNSFTDRVLRQAIITDLDGMLVTLRAQVRAVLEAHGVDYTELPDEGLRWAPRQEPSS